MTFDTSHWKNPRATIATRYQNNDMAYATHGAQQALYAVRMLDLKPSQAALRSILDVGCGTGRMARILAFQFASVIGYDPVAECIALARTECQELTMPTITYTTNPADIPLVDCAVCINVLEHLAPGPAQALLALIESKIKPGGRYVLWYGVTANSDLINPKLTPAERAEDAVMAAEGGGINVRTFVV